MCKKAFSENMAGTQEANFNFKQTTFQALDFLTLVRHFVPADPTKVPTGVAIGQKYMLVLVGIYDWYS